LHPIFGIFPSLRLHSACTQIGLVVQSKSNAIQCSSAIVECLNKPIGAQHTVTMGNKSSLFLRNEEIAQIQEETGCEYDFWSGCVITLGFFNRRLSMRRTKSKYALGYKLIGPRAMQTTTSHWSAKSISGPRPWIAKMDSLSFDSSFL